MEWERAVALYVIDQRARGAAPRTIGNRTTLLRALAARLGGTPAGVTGDDLLLYIGRGVAASSMQRERSDLRSFFGWAQEHGIRDDDPSIALPKVRVPRRRPRPFTLEQIERMLAAGAYERTRAMILLGYLEGMRAHEIAKMHGRDIDHDTGTIRVLGKGGVVRHVPIHALLEPVIDRMPRDGYWFPARGKHGGEHVHSRSVSDLLSRARQRAGVEGDRLTGHSLRHSYATQLLRNGADLLEVRDLLGHASVASTQIYTAVDEDRLAAAHARLPAVAVPTASGRPSTLAA